MKQPYESPKMDVKEFAQFENVFTYCTKGNVHEQGCMDVTGSGNSSDVPPGVDPSTVAAFAGGLSDSGF